MTMIMNCELKKVVEWSRYTIYKILFQNLTEVTEEYINTKPPA
jgi:hypothetical protein